MDLHSLMLAESATAASGTLAVNHAAPRVIYVPELPMSIEMAVAGTIVGDWSELEGGVRIAVDFELVDPEGRPGETRARLVVNPPVQGHPAEPLVIPFAFTPTFPIREEGGYALRGLVDGRVIKTVPIAILRLPSEGVPGQPTA